VLVFGLTDYLHAVLIYNLFYCLINHLNLQYFPGVSYSFSVSVVLQFNNSELRDLYVNGSVDS